MLNCNGAFLNLTERTERRIFMKKLLYFMKDYKKESVLAPLFKMLEAFFELFVPLAAKYCAVIEQVRPTAASKRSNRHLDMRKWTR